MKQLRLILPIWLIGILLAYALFPVSPPKLSAQTTSTKCDVFPRDTPTTGIITTSNTDQGSVSLRVHSITPTDVIRKLQFQVDPAKYRIDDIAFGGSAQPESYDSVSGKYTIGDGSNVVMYPNQFQNFTLQYTPLALTNETSVNTYIDDDAETNHMCTSNVFFRTTTTPPQTCTPPQTGTPPNCVDPPPETCPTGTSGTPPNCVPVGGSGATPDVTQRDIKLISIGIVLFIMYKFANAFRFRSND